MVEVSVSGIAAGAEKAVEGIMKVEPMVATVAGMFVPGAAPIVAIVQPFVVMAAPFIERALTDLAAGNNGDVLSAFFDLIQHISKGQPNSPILSGGVAADASAQGSG